MKRVISLFLILLTTVSTGCAQTQKQARLNLDFEKIKNGKATGWADFGSPDYIISLDSTNVANGKYAVSIEYKKDNPDYKAISFVIPGNYDGKKITLSGYIKTENVSGGFAGLWMRIDPQIAFNNMKNKGIKGTTAWKKYEITLKMNPSKTKQIVVGGLLVGKGKMWLDQLKITIDGQDIENLKPIEKPLARADKDTAFAYGSGITNIKTDKTTIENLKILGLVWGFLKYYHPNVAKGDYNWDHELFRILPQVLNAGNSSARDKILVQWINKLGSFPESENKDEKKGKVKMKPDLGWLTSANISSELSTLLLRIKNAKRGDESYYVSLIGGAGNPIFQHENPYATMKFPDAGFRLLALYRYWNIIQYFYPYKYLIGEDWKNVLTAFIPKMTSAEDETAYTLATLRLIASIHDTHANIWGNNATLDKYFGKRYAAPELTFIDSQAVVQGFYDEKAGKETGLKKGDIIMGINGRRVDEIVTASLKTTPASNYPTQLRNIAPKLLRSNDSLISITYLRNGLRHKEALKTYSLNEINIYQKYQRKDTCFKMITPDIAYLYLGSIKSKYLASIFKEISNTKGLIIDLRCYPSEFVVFTLGKYLMPEKTDFVKFSFASIAQPGMFSVSAPLKTGEKNKQYYKGKIVILINEITQSQAEYTTMAFRVAPKAIVIGSTTAGADGNVSQFYLPGGISTMISGLGIYYPNGDETQRIGIIPDITVKPTISGIKSGKDEILDKAIEIINQ